MDSVKMEKNPIEKKFDFPMSGRWKPVVTGVQLASGDFRVLTNMRYTDKSIQAVKGMSKINTVAVVDVEAGAPEISYTTLQMSTSGTQVITVSGGQSPFTWSVPAGGGSVSPTTGSSTTYTAPATNPECAYNPTIRVCDALGQCEEITLAINGYAEAIPAVGNSAVNSSGTCQVTIYRIAYKCDGVVYTGCESSSCCSCDLSGYEDCAWTGPTCTGYTCPAEDGGCWVNSGDCVATCTCAARTWSSNPGDYDLRSAEEITAGCCPYQLL